MTKEEFDSLKRGDKVSRNVTGNGARTIYGTIKAKRDNLVAILWDGDDIAWTTAGYLSLNKEKK